MREEVLQKMTGRLQDRFEKRWTEGLKLLAYTGGLLNWIGDYITDENINWSKQFIGIDNLRLTGTTPEFNEIIIHKCQRDPKKLRQIINANEKVRDLFGDLDYDPDDPILLRYENKIYHVLDGMYEVVAAIRDGYEELEVYIATPTSGRPRPYCEPHLIYDLLRPYQRGYNQDTAGLIAALRYVKNSYCNAEELIRKRFSDQWIVDNKKIHSAIKQVLES